MLIAYVDETGDTGSIAKAGASRCFGLGCVFLDDIDWKTAFDGLLDFRRRLRSTYGIPMRAEVKAKDLVSGSGPLRPLGLAPAVRSTIYRAHLRILDPLRLRAFGVVIDKASPQMIGQDIFAVGWITMLNRLERLSKAEQQTLLVIHDHGENDAVRREVRKARRHLTAGKKFGTGSFVLPLERLIDDPVPRDSKQSYLIQLADIVAYATWRTYVPPGAAVGRVVPQWMWDEAGYARHGAANKLSGGDAGVVVRKR
jgi:hypothetical protein